MDNSKEFILMCEKGVKLQKLWKPAKGDYVYSQRLGNYKPTIFILTKQDIAGAPCNYGGWIVQPISQRILGGRTKITCLFRQDQLQDMMGNGIRCSLYDFVEWTCDGTAEDSDVPIPNSDLYMMYSSWEQLWLAFVMLKKYSKRWNGKDWITTTQ